jgi:CheY-like chemotaxis protein
MVFHSGYSNLQIYLSGLASHMCRVLIIDDEKSICELLTCVLSRRGIKTDVAYDGQEGLKKFLDNGYDVVVTDIRMPGMDGNAVAHQIRKSARSNTPIVGMSGTSWLVDQDKFDVVLEKPMSIQSFMDTVVTLSSALDEA